MNDKIINFNIENINLQFRVINNKLYSNWEMDSSNIVESIIVNNKVMWKDSDDNFTEYTNDIQKIIDINKIKILFLNENDIDYLLYSMGYTNI